MTNMKTSSQPTWKQQQSKYKPNQETNDDFHASNAVRKNYESLIKYHYSKKKNSANAQKLKEVRKEIINIYTKKVPSEYIRCLVYKFRNSVED